MRERNIFIGLGGSGVNTVASLKYKIYSNTPGEHPLETMEENYRFLFCDTDQADILRKNEYYKSKFEGGRKLFIDPKNDLINLGTVNPYAVYEEAKAKAPDRRTEIDNAILEACNEKMVAKLKHYPLSDGAGAFRCNSRVAFARMSDSFVDVLKRCIQQLLDTRTAMGDEVALRYWIVGSSNGGTGSGTFMDVLFLVNMLHKAYRHNEEPKTTLVMYMPRFYIDANKGDAKYLCNAQAVFHEMNGYQQISCRSNMEMKNNVKQMMFVPQNLPINDSVYFRPFSSCIPIDVQTERGNSLMSSEVMYSNTAELLFFIHQSQGRDVLASSFKSWADNFLDEAVLKEPLDYLQPMGYVALRKPESEFEKYMDHRLKLELLTYGIIGRIPEDVDIKTDIASLYKNVIAKELFDGQENTFSQLIEGIVKSHTDRSFSSNLIMEDGKARKRLTSGISKVAADKVVEKFTLAIDDIYEGTSLGDTSLTKFSKKNVLKRIEEELWAWVEEQVIQKGLAYVKQVMDGLDLYATEQLTCYLGGNSVNSATALAEKVNQIDEQLPDLRHKAEEITIAEHLWGSNEHDVRAYYLQLLEYIRAKGNVVLANKRYDLLALLCKGDNGVIDKIRFYIQDLKMAAENAAKIPEENFRSLARFFENSACDVTTVYLPEISKFVKEGGWVADNYFSRLYSYVLEQSNEMIPGYGFLPIRSYRDGQEHSVEQFIRKLIECNKNELIAEGYYFEDKENSHSMLFRRNRWSVNPAKIIEDLLKYIEQTYEKAYKPGKLEDEWYKLTLQQLYQNLTIDEQQDIRDTLNPQLFYSYRTSAIGQGQEIVNVIAPSEEMAVNIFGYQKGSTSKYDQSSSTTVAYMLRAKVGMSLDSYMLSDTILQRYRKEADKTTYHTHVAWGECNGNYLNLRLKTRVERELIAFAKYMILNEYTYLIPDMYYKPMNIAEQSFYKQTPMIIGEDTIAFTLVNAVDVICDYVALHYDNNTFEEYVSSGENVLYSSIYKVFKKQFIDKQYEAALTVLISHFSEMKEMKTNYLKVKTNLVRKLNELWSKAIREPEKAILIQIMRLFDEEKELSDYSKFIL